MNSHNHPMLGCPCGWLFRYVAGIRRDETAVGFNRFILDPIFLKELDFAGADYESRAGLVKSHWKRVPEGVQYDFQVPAGTVASVRTPDNTFQPFREGTYTLIYK